MLSKPTNPTPYLNTIDASDITTFQSSCLHSDDIAGVRLCVDNGRAKFYSEKLNTNSDYFSVDNSQLTVELKKEQSDGENSSNKLEYGYQVRNSDFKRKPLGGDFADILDGGNYSWQLRLYQEKCESLIGYGYVNDVIEIADYVSGADQAESKSYNGVQIPFDINATHILKVRPHANMFYEVNGVYKGNSDWSNYNNKEYGFIKNRLLNFYDTEVHYQININNKTYPILAYYYGTNTVQEWSPSLNGLMNMRIDKYGDPLFSYIEIAADANDVFEEEMEYTVYANYKDSDEFAFSVHDKPALELCDANNRVVSSSEIYEFSDHKINLYIKQRIGEDNYKHFYAQSYVCKLYDTTDYDERLVYNSGNMYQDLVTFTYDRFETQHTYRLYIQIVDELGRIYEFERNLYPDFGNALTIQGLSVEHNRDHGSIVIDWQDMTFLNGKDKIPNGHRFVNDGDEKVCVVDHDNTITFNQYENGKPISTSKPAISVIFKCDANRDANQKIVELQGAYHRFTLYIDQFKRFRISTSFLPDKYYMPYSSEACLDVSEALKTPSETSVYSVPFVWNDNISWLETDVHNGNNPYYWHEESALTDFWWQFSASEKEITLMCCNPPNGYEWTYTIPIGVNVNFLQDIVFTLYGDVSYKFVGLWNGVVPSNVNGEWDENTILKTDFKNENLSATIYANNTSNIKKFKLFKKYSKQPTLHFLGETRNPSVRVFEDYMVGSKCDYIYFLYPVLQNEGEQEKYGNPIVSEPISIDDGIVRVIGLKQDKNNFNTYTIDKNNVWHIWMNLSDRGFNNNLDKTFNDTQHAYSKESTGKRKYRTIQITGLIGKYDCETRQYIDTYDDIVEWENFMNNGEMKALIDLRGITSLGDIESNSFEYAEKGETNVSVNFNFRQLAGIEENSILADQLLANPMTQYMLEDYNKLFLKGKGNTNEFLVVNREG